MEEGAKQTLQTRETKNIKYHLTERHIYGSARLGMDRTMVEMAPTLIQAYPLEPAIPATEESERYLGRKYYELSNHLGNVLTVITDEKRMILDGTNYSHYESVVVSVTDYSPFGVSLTERTFTTTEGYRYGFNGKEEDNEGMGGGKQTYDYGFRIYNPALAKFLSVDPLTKQYPELTTYQFASNTPIWAIDLDGAEALVIQASVRITCLIATVSVGVSLAFTSTSVTIYITPEAGLGTGVSFTGGVSAAFYPNATNSEQFEGWGMNVGGSILGIGADISAELGANGVGLAGFGGSVPKIGGGAGAEAHLSFGYSFIIETVKYEDAINTFYECAESLGITKSEAEVLYKQGREAFENLSKKNDLSPETIEEPINQNPSDSQPQSPKKSGEKSAPKTKPNVELKKRFEAQPEMKKIVEQRNSNSGVG